MVSTLRREPNREERVSRQLDALRRRLELLSHTISGNFTVRVVFDDGTPRTDGTTVIALNPAVHAEELGLLTPAWWVVQKAVCGHESFHVRFTDMAAYRDGILALTRMGLSSNVASSVANALEDARIEFQGASAWEGVRDFLRLHNDLAFQKLEAAMDGKSHDERLVAALVARAVVGQIPRGTPDEARETIEALEAHIEAARQAQTTAEAMRHALEVGRRILPLLRGEPVEEVRMSGTAGILGIPMPGEADGPRAREAVSSEEAEDEGASPLEEEALGRTGTDPGQRDTDDDPTDSTVELAGVAPPDPPADADPAEDEAEADRPSLEQGDGDGSQAAVGGRSADGSSEEGQEPAHELPLDPLSEGDGAGGALWHEKYGQVLRDAEEELSSAEREADEAAAREPVSPEVEGMALAEARVAIALGFREEPVFVTRFVRAAYEEAFSQTAFIRERLYREIRRTLTPPRAEPLTAKTKGRLDPRRVWRTPAFGDVAVFERKVRRNSLGGAAVYLLVDCSGSMSETCLGGEKRSDVARKAAVALADALWRAGVPHAVIGFSDESHIVVHYRLKGWDDGQESHVRLGAILPREDNRDGFSIRLAARELRQRREEAKILLVLSDGLPCARGYVGPVAVEDTAAAVREARREGILVAGLYFGWEDDRSIAQARTIYPDLSCLFHDLSHLPEAVGRTVVRLLRQAELYG